MKIGEDKSCRLNCAKTSTSLNEKIIETLTTNLSEDEFNINELKELYHLRWSVETAYNVLKSRMKFEELFDSNIDIR